MNSEKCCGANRKNEAQRAVLDAAFNEIRELLESRSFASLEEANDFVNRHMQERNQASNDEFEGLSPEQMHRFLYFPFESSNLVEFPSCLHVSPEAPSSPCSACWQKASANRVKGDSHRQPPAQAVQGYSTGLF